MKTNFFLAAGLLVTAFGFAQTTYYFPTSPVITGTSGNHNVYFGFEAGLNSTTHQNVFIGSRAGKDNTGELNTMVGYAAGQRVDSTSIGSRNCFYGFTAGQDATGSHNVFMGHSAGRNTSGGSNTFIGRGAGSEVASGSNNIVLGVFAGLDAFSLGDNNILIGPYAGRSSSGSNNIFIGTAGKSSSGSNNIFIGKNVGQNVTDSDKLYIDKSETSAPLIYGDFDASRELKFNAKKVGIGYEGTSNPGFGDFYDTFDTSTLKYRLFVRGGILAEEVRIRSYVNWADYVFADNYNLMPLNEVEKYIADNGHLPNMPSAEEVEKEGLAVGNIVKLQQEKIEELTLHLIKQEKEIEILKEQVQLLLNKQ